MAASTYVDFFQQMDKRTAIPIAIIGILGPILAAVGAVVHRANRRMFVFLLAACGLGTAGAMCSVLTALLARDPGR
jgi:hypothetical protein